MYGHRISSADYVLHVIGYSSLTKMFLQGLGKMILNAPSGCHTLGLLTQGRLDFSYQEIVLT